MDRWKTSDSKSQKKGRKSRETLCFSIFCRSGGSKSRAKAAGAEPCEKTKDTSRPKHHFGGGTVEKVHAVVAQSSFASQNVQNLFGS